MPESQIDSICNIIEQESIKQSTVRAYDIDTLEWMNYKEVKNFPIPKRDSKMPIIISHQGELHFELKRFTSSILKPQLRRSFMSSFSCSEGEILLTSESASDIILTSENLKNQAKVENKEPHREHFRYICSLPEVGLSSEPFEYLESEKFEDLLEQSSLQ